MLLARNNNVFDTFFGDPWFSDPWFDDRDIQKAEKKLYGHNDKKLMLTDIKESDKGYELEMDLPGFKKEEIKASLENGYLIISAEKGLEQDEKDNEGKKYIRRERYTGSCQRAFYVGDEIEQGDIKASFKHGILRLDIPKKQPKPQVEENKFISIEG
ncbi:MAG: Hsp20/alpha crystallin family protein [Lachnobacterium sp.]|nr:Hsp20/alpha crystallin family protein [Lachnobacterium sp.]MDD7713896.1 Hsp20/alpha crystallin family protein [Lachnobacterium sp.]MDY5461749.1 Hsp20/alpha crystallin family protein [Agathobacter sp.]